MRAPTRTAGTLVLVVALVGVLAGGWWWARSGHTVLPFGEVCTAQAAQNTAELDPEQAGNAAVIASVAVRRALPARAASIAIATAMQESKLRNVGYGDRDSLGLFQQRPSQGWGTRAQVLDPVHASNAFYDALVKIHGFESMPITEVAQRIQRSAYPQAYAQHEPEARVLASALSGFSTAAFSCRLHEVPVAAASTPGSDGLTGRARAAAEAATRETGQRVVASAGTGGRTVRIALTGEQAQRRAWSVAQWAVARSAELGIVSVQTDGKAWTRADGVGWKAGTGSPSGAAVVLVTVAAGNG
jgi:hypothetical protein